MRRHGFTANDIEAVIAHPEWHEVEVGGAEIAWVRYQSEYLKVVYANEESGLEVITVGLRKSLPENLR
jgi:hypothetical protein